MDQFISSMAEEGNALMIDCEQPLKEDCAKLIPLTSPDLVFLVVDTDKRHELAGGEYNKRRETCESAVSKLGVQKSLRFASMPQLLEGNFLLYYVFSNQDFFAGKHKLTDLEFRRARHVISEIERTEQAAKALDSGDYELFGKLMNASHDSLK